MEYVKLRPCGRGQTDSRPVLWTMLGVKRSRFSQGI